MPGIYTGDDSDIKMVDGDSDYYNKNYRAQENIKPSFFFLNPHIQAWKTYYAFEEIFISLPDVAPEDEKEIPVVLNERVMHYMNYFQNRGRRSFSIWLARSGKYIPNMRKILQERGMPTDLVYLSMIESGFNVKARSHAAAVGPWQFIKPTAKRYGLRVDSWVDERMDPKKSTEAAANYLSDLYAMFQNWELAAAGYNCGEDRVQNAIDKYQINDFWQISEFTLPRETKNYVPKLMAALIIAKDPAKYGFVGIKYHEPVPYETVRVAPQKKLSDIARVLGVSSTKLVELNPSLIHKATPPGGPYPIHVPVGYASIANQKSQQIASLTNVNPNIAKRSGTFRYKVRRGDTLGGIARKYRTSVSKIKRTNGLKSNTIRVGQRLKIPGKSAPAYRASSKNKLHTAKYKVKRGDTIGAIAARHRVSSSDIRRANNIKGSLIRTGDVLTIPGASGRYYGDDTSAKKTTRTVKYKVKSGDTLGGIAGRHRVSVSTIRRANGIKGSNIRAGQTLKIPQITSTTYASSGSKSKGTKTKSNGSYKYRVKSGDTLGGIAQKHGVRLSSLKSANNIKGSNIRKGQLLTIPGSNGSYSKSSSSSSKPSKYKVRSGDTLGGIAEKHRVKLASLKSANNIKGSSIRTGQVLVIPNGNYSAKSSSGSGPMSYKVKSGDTLWEIANKHNTTVAKIKKWNNLKSNSLTPGKKLTIYK
ncbi:MAG: LysM peptidoglycan-binding domain-containing protein [Thermodesulfobacteriota bacterium]